MLCALLYPRHLFAAAPPSLKDAATAHVDGNAKLVQQMVDTVFSFGGAWAFQEIRTSAYLTGILEKNGFKITRGIAGIPTAWTATWGEGGPLIAMGSDEDGLRGLSQIPGSPAPAAGERRAGAWRRPQCGMPLMIAAALAAKAVMQKNNIKGRLMLWPGIAEETVGRQSLLCPSRCL